MLVLKVSSSENFTGGGVWLAHRPGYYFSDAELDLRIIDELAISDNQRRK